MDSYNLALRPNYEHQEKLLFALYIKILIGVFKIQIIVCMRDVNNTRNDNILR